MILRANSSSGDDDALHTHLYVFITFISVWFRGNICHDVVIVVTKAFSTLFDVATVSTFHQTLI